MGLNSSICSIIRDVFPQKRVLVLGDVIVDEYITGKVKRISPEAPVPILDYCERKLVVGGSCNVANNLASLGAKVIVAGTVSDDEPGVWLKEELRKNGIVTDGLVIEPNRPTTLKTRFATKGQQLLRMDNELTKAISKQTRSMILDYVRAVISKVDAVVISDYCKGVCADRGFLQEIIQLCNNNHVLSCIDSKRRDITAFSGIDFVKPNNLELEEVVGFRIDDEESFDKAGKLYLSKSGAKALIVTRGSKGISIFLPGKVRKDFSARNVQVYDVCGAGDTVISTISLALISGIDIENAVKLSNVAAGIVISYVGTVAVKSEQLIREVDEEQNC